MKFEKVKTIEAHHSNVTSWKLEEVINRANAKMGTIYTKADVANMFVRYCVLYVEFNDAETWEDHAGHDHDVDWDHPNELKYWDAEDSRILEQKASKPTWTQVLPTTGMDEDVFFWACPFVDEDGNASWSNFGGVWYDNGDEYEWIEDDRGLTKREAESLASWLNTLDEFRVSLCSLDIMRVREEIAKWEKNNG